MFMMMKLIEREQGSHDAAKTEAERPAWIVQRCVDVASNTYQDFPGYEKPLTMKQAMEAIDALEQR
jgi:hypothetical protein